MFPGCVSHGPPSRLRAWPPPPRGRDRTRKDAATRGPGPTGPWAEGQGRSCSPEASPSRGPVHLGQRGGFRKWDTVRGRQGAGKGAGSGATGLWWVPLPRGCRTVSLSLLVSPRPGRAPRLLLTEMRPLQTAVQSGWGGRVTQRTGDLLLQVRAPSPGGSLGPGCGGSAHGPRPRPTPDTRARSSAHAP